MRGIADGRKKTEADVRRADRRGAVPARGRAARGPRRRCGVRGPGATTSAAGRRGTDAGADRRRRLRARQRRRRSASNRGPRIARDLRGRARSAGGKSGYDPLNGADRRLRHADRVHPPGPRATTRVRAIVLRIDSPGGSAVASDAIWRELMIARNERADRPIVASMSDLAASGGYYIAMPAHVDRRAAGDADRIDRHLRRQDRHRRRLREARRAHRVDEHRHATRRSNSPVAPVQRRRARKKLRGAARRRSTISSSRRSPSRATRRRRRSTRSRRGASGPAGRRRRTAWSTSSAGSIARDRASPSSARRLRPTARSSSWSYPPRKSFYEILTDAVRRRRAQALRLRVAVGEPVERRARGAARDARPARDVPPRRAARADAVHVLAMRHGCEPRSLEDCVTSCSA